jgi:hypothetical protein
MQGCELTQHSCIEKVLSSQQTDVFTGESMTDEVEAESELGSFLLSSVNPADGA